jgi:hypothetical protein
MSKILVAPNGLLIRGTLERLSGVGLIYKADLKNGRLEFEYFGTTEIWYDETRTAENEKGESIFVDTEGNEWPESQLVRNRVGYPPDIVVLSAHVGGSVPVLTRAPQQEPLIL